MRVRKLAAAALALLLLCLLIAAQRQPRVLSPLDTVRVSDTFTAPNGTLLQNHIADTGQTWQTVPYAPSIPCPACSISIDGNWAHHNSGGYRTIYLASAILGADSYVAARVKFRDRVDPYLLLRAKTPNETYLAVYYDNDSQSWVMIATVNYTGPKSVYVLGTWTETIIAGDTRDVYFKAVGDELRFYTSVNGQWVERIFAESYYVLEGGYSGLGLNRSSNASGTYIDNFESGEILSPTPTPSPSPSPSPVGTPCALHWHLTTDTATRKVWDCY